MAVSAVDVARIERACRSGLGAEWNGEQHRERERANV